MDNQSLVRKLEQIKTIANECLQELSSAVSTEEISSPRRSTKDLDLTLPIRPFLKQYASDLSGPKKFVLLLARLAGGEVGKEIPLEEVEKNWNALMGIKFNRFFSQQAKDNGWVETKKKGIYTLRASWSSALT